jgi:hypothetical protein
MRGLPTSHRSSDHLRPHFTDLLPCIQPQESVRAAHRLQKLAQEVRIKVSVSLLQEVICAVKNGVHRFKLPVDLHNIAA